MTEREKMLWDAIDRMTGQFPVYYDEDLVRQLACYEGPPDRERILLAALVEITDKCLGRSGYGSDGPDDQVDTLAESGPERAVLALAEFGLMERLNVRFGRWTPAGKTFLVESMREWEQTKDRIRTDVEAKRRKGEARAERVRQARQLRWAKYGLIAASIVAGGSLAGWLAFSSKLF